jgi:DNA-binding MarR family transcriptional regulator
MEGFSMAASSRKAPATLRHFRGHSKSGAAFTALVLETFRLNARLLAAGDQLTKSVGLTSARWQVMAALRKAPVPVTVATLARQMGLQRQSVQRTVDLLVAERLAAFVDNPRHLRAKLAVLTQKGRTTLKRSHPLQVEWANRIAQGIATDRLDLCAELLRELRGRLGDRLIVS